MNCRAAWTALGIGLTGAAVRAYWAWAPRTVRWDEPDYLIIARNLLQGEGYRVFNVPDVHTPPLLPFLSAGAAAAGVPLTQAMAFWHVLAGAAIGVLLFFLVREVTGDVRLAGLAGILAALSPALAVWPLYWGSMTESVFIALLLGGGLTGIRALRGGRTGTWAATGLLFGLAYLARPEGLGWVVLFLVAGGVANWRGRRPVLPLAVYAATFALVALPYVGFLYAKTGHLTFSGKEGASAALGAQITELGGGLGNDRGAMLDRAGKEILWLSDERFENTLAHVMARDPVASARRIVLGLKHIPPALAGPLLGPLMLALIALGWWGQHWTRRRWREEAFWWLAVAPLGVVPLFVVEPRLLLPQVPVALVWAARGILHLLAWGQMTADVFPALRRVGVIWAPLVVAGLLVALISGQAAAASAGSADLAPSHEEAGRWLGEHTPAGSAVMSRNPEVGLYADRPLVAFPNATWAEVLAYGWARGAAYLVTDSWELEKLRPQLSVLAEPSTAPGEVEYLAEFHDARRTTWVYRFTGVGD